MNPIFPNKMSLNNSIQPHDSLDVENLEPRYRSITRVPEQYNNYLDTSRMGHFPRLQDEALTDSSDDEKNQMDSLREIQSLVVKDNDFKIATLQSKGTFIEKK